MNREDIQKLAHLARLSLNEQEIVQYQDISDILTWMTQINQVETKNITPMEHPSPHPLRLREDVVTAASPYAEPKLYCVPPVLEGEE